MIDYILNHWNDIVGIVGGIVIAARIIVKLTPTPKDDSILESIVNALKHIGLNVKALALLATCTMLISCGTLPDGTKAFLGVTAPQGLGILKGAVIREAPIVYGEVKSAKESNLTAAKQPIDVQP